MLSRKQYGQESAGKIFTIYPNKKRNITFTNARTTASLIQYCYQCNQYWQCQPEVTQNRLQVGAFPEVFMSTLNCNGLPSKLSGEQLGRPVLWWKDKKQRKQVEAREVCLTLRRVRTVEQVEAVQAPSLGGFTTCLEKAPGSLA